MTEVDDVIKKVFLDVENFLKNVAALDVFEALIFNYKTKIGLPDPVAFNFVSVVKEFTDDINLLLKEYSEQQVDPDAFLVSDSENLTDRRSNKFNISGEGDPLVFGFCNDEIDPKSLELVEVPARSRNICGEQEDSCDSSDAEKADEFICTADENEHLKSDDDCALNLGDDCSFKLVENDDEETTQKAKNKLEVDNKNKNERFGRTNERKRSCNLEKRPKVESQNENDHEDYDCNMCDKTFPSLELWNNHLNQTHGKGYSSCQISDESMLFRAIDNQSLPENLPFYCCKSCLYAYKTPIEFEAHSCKEICNAADSEGNVGDYFHLVGKYLVSNPELLASMRKFRCGICCEEYRSLNRMLYHLVRCSQGPYPCEVCKLECSSKRELNKHKKKTHQETNSFFCDECNLAFKLRTSLQRHKVNHHERGHDTTCKQCNLTFSKRIQFTYHMIREHQAERKFLCQVCGKKFSTRGSLTAHLSCHTESFQFSCSYCNKKFRQKEKLKYHTRIHTGERPHLCPICGKSFIRKTKLDDHMKRHRGEKQYICPVCCKCYTSSWDMKVHLKRVHNTIPTGIPPALPLKVTESAITEINANEAAGDIHAVSSTTINLLSTGEATGELPQLPEDATLAQLAELSLPTSDPSLVNTLAPSDGKFVVQLEQTQVPTSLLQTPDDGTRLLLHLGQNNTSSPILLQLEGAQVTTPSTQPTLLQSSTLFTVTDALQMAPIVDDLNLSTVPTQYLQLSTTPATGDGNDSTATAPDCAGSSASVPVHIQLPVPTVPLSVPVSLPQSTTSVAAPFSLQTMPIQTVFTPTTFNVNGISY